MPVFADAGAATLASAGDQGVHLLGGSAYGVAHRRQAHVFMWRLEVHGTNAASRTGDADAQQLITTSKNAKSSEIPPPPSLELAKVTTGSETLNAST
jgi:hypothetical protein